MFDSAETFKDLSPKEKELIDTYLYRVRCEQVIGHHRLGTLDALEPFDVAAMRDVFARQLAAGKFTSAERGFTVETYVDGARAMQQQLDKYYTGRAKEICDELASELTYLPNDFRKMSWVEKVEPQAAEGAEKRGAFDALTPSQKGVVDMNILLALTSTVYNRHNNGTPTEPPAWNLAEMRENFAKTIGLWYQRSMKDGNGLLSGVIEMQQAVKDSATITDACKTEFYALCKELTYLPQTRTANWIEGLKGPDNKGRGGR